MPSSPRFSAFQLGILLICVFLFAIGQFHRAAGAIIAPVWAESYDLTPEQLGTVIATIFFATIIAQGPVGVLLDRFGPRAVLPATIAVVALGTYGCTVAESYIGLIVSRALIGIGLSSTGIGMYVLLAKHFPKDQFGYLNGLMVALGGIGGLLGTYPLATLITSLGWQAVLIGLAGLTLALGCAIMMVKVPTSDREADNTPESTVTFQSLLLDPAVRRILALGIVTYAPIVTITGLWGGPYFVDVHDLTLEAAGLYMFAAFGATILAGVAFGMLDRKGVARSLVIGAALVTSVMCLVVLATAPRLPVAVAGGLIFCMVFAQQFYIPLLAELRDTVPANALGRASSLFSILAVLAIPVMQTGFGIVLAQFAGYPPETGYRAGFAAMAGVIAVAGLIYVLHGRRQTP